jgi:outer membrane protein assembly factor BamB
MIRFHVAGTLMLALGAAAIASGQSTTRFDWPQFRGPERSGVSKETGLMKQWPASGPPRVWRATGLGSGYGSVAVHGDRVYVQGLRGRESSVTSLDRSSGRVIWTRALGMGRGNDRGPGPRATPTVDRDRLYVLSENGDLACLRTEDGSVVWQRNILSIFRGRNIQWLISESPLVDGDRVIVTPGGQGATIVALNKMTGEPVWTSKDLSDPAGYASAIAADVGGVRTIMTLTDRAGVGVRASDGKLLWRYERVANNTANAATPIFHDNKVFYSSNYGTGGVLLALTPAGGTVQAREVYFTRSMKNHHGGMVLVNGFLYGFDSTVLTCIDFATGEVRWRHRSVGKGSLTYADGQLYILSENYVMGLADASPEGYREKGRFQVPDQGLYSWAYPVVSDGRLYIRTQDSLTAYNIRAQ